MKEVFSIIFLILTFLTWPKSIRSQETTLSLNDAISIAQNRSIIKTQSLREYERADNQLNLLQARLNPQLSLNANAPNFYKSSSAVVQPNGSISFQPISQDNSLLKLQLSQKILPTNTTLFAEGNIQRYQDFEGAFTSFNTVPFRLGIEQPLHHVNYDLWNQKFYQLDRKIARKKLTVSSEKIAAEVTAAYFQVLTAQIDEEIARTNIENNQKLYEIAKERFELGKISKSDLLQLELGLSSAAQNKMKATRALISSNADLKEAMNKNLSTDDFINVLTPEIPELQPIDPTRAANLAWENRPEQLEYKKLVLEAEQAMEIADRENGWQTILRASIGFTGSGNTFGESYSQPKYETRIEVGVNIPLMDGKKRKLSKEDAKSNYVYNKTENEFSELTFKQNIRQLVLQFNQLQKEAGQALNSYEIARQRYDIVNQRYVLNDISITDLSLAFGERDLAWRNYINLLRAYWITYYSIRQLTLFDFEEGQIINYSL